MHEYEIGDELTSEPAPEPTPTPAPTPAKVIIRPKKQDRTTTALFMVGALVAIGGIGFAVGHATAPAASSALDTTNGSAAFDRGNFPSLAPGQTFGGLPALGAGLGGALGSGISGTVQSISGTTLTILEANGSTVTIDLAGSTTYHGQASAGSGDVKVGSTVTVQTSIAAQSGASPDPAASGGRTLTAKDVLITQP